MFLTSMKKPSSQRQSAPIPLHFYPNIDEDNRLVLESEEHYYFIHFESMDEVLKLLSQAHQVHHAYEKTR